MPRSKNAINIKNEEEKKVDNCVEKIESNNDDSKINNKEIIKNTTNKDDNSTNKENAQKITKQQIKNSNNNIKITNKSDKTNKENEDEYEYEEEEEEEEEEAEEEEDKKENNVAKKEVKNSNENNGKVIIDSNDKNSSTVDEESSDEEEEEEEEEEEYESYYDTYESNYRKSNMKLINQWSEEVFDNDDVFTDGEVSNLMGFLLTWMLNLVDPIIPKSMENSFIETFAPVSSTTNDYYDFIDDLPLLHKNTLKYIIGFFREIAKNVNLTQESNQSIADTFSSFFVCSTFTTVDPFTRIKLIDIAPKFILFCLDNLDVTDVYPLNPCYEIRDDK